MSIPYGKFWSAVPKMGMHPRRVPILEAFRIVQEPLSAIDLVDLFDGQDITMWDAAHHLRALEALGVVEPAPEGWDPMARRDTFGLPYRLVIRRTGDNE